MNIRIQILIIGAAILALIYVVRKIKNKGIELKYSLLWLLLGLGILVFAGFPKIGNLLSGLLGVQQPMNLLFFAGFCFLLPIVFSLSVAVSKLSNKIKRLTQETALLRKELERKEEKEEGNSEE